MKTYLCEAKMKLLVSSEGSKYPSVSTSKLVFGNTSHIKICFWQPLHVKKRNFYNEMNKENENLLV